MHMKYLLLGIHKLFSVYLICSATKEASQMEANLNVDQSLVSTVSLWILCAFL